MSDSINNPESFVLLKLDDAQEVASQALDKLLLMTEIHDQIPWKLGVSPNRSSAEIAQSFSTTLAIFHFELEDCKEEIGDSLRGLLIWNFLSTAFLGMKCAYLTHVIGIYYQTQEVNASSVTDYLEMRNRHVVQVQKVLSEMLQPAIYRMYTDPEFFDKGNLIVKQMETGIDRADQLLEQLSDIVEPIIHSLEHHGSA